MKEKKNNGYISAGVVLIAIQYFSYWGNYDGSNNLPSITGFDQLFTPYGIFYVIGANIFLLIGIILLIIGIKKKNEGNVKPVKKYKEYRKKENNKKNNNNHDNSNNEIDSDIMKLLNSDKKGK